MTGDAGPLEVTCRWRRRRGTQEGLREDAVLRGLGEAGSPEHEKGPHPGPEAAPAACPPRPPQPRSRAQLCRLPQDAGFSPIPQATFIGEVPTPAIVSEKGSLQRQGYTISLGRA